MAAIELAQLWNEIINVQHAEDWKVFSSGGLFFTSFLMGSVLFYDVVRGIKSKLARSRWHYAIIADSMVYYTMSLFGLARFLDGLADVTFVIENPNAVTTLSQQSLILELPLIGVSIATMLFMAFYLNTYRKIKPGETRQGWRDISKPGNVSVVASSTS